MKLSNIKNSFVEVFSNYKYILLTLTIAILFIVFNSIVVNYKYLFEYPSLITVYNLLIGGLNSITTESLVSLIAISILTGILFSMLTYKIRRIKESNRKATSVGGIGVILGTLVPACSACGFGILALLGYGSLLAVLPFAGLELAALSIIILIIAIIVISNQIAVKICKV